MLDPALYFGTALGRRAERLWRRPWVKAAFFFLVFLLAWLSGTGTAHA